MKFPDQFIWGASASAFQIEGALQEDGRGLSIWDIACRRPDFIKGNHTAKTACDFYHRYKEDIRLMKEIGIKAFRMSISWPRILPDGTGKLNQAGLDFYRRVIEELVENGIAPYVTLFHWDMPYALYLKGGMLNPDSPNWFAEYAGVLVDRFSDIVDHWITLNEPQCFIDLGHRLGINAPCLSLPMNEVLLAGHNFLLAHGKSVQAMRAAAKQKLEIGIAPVGCVNCPETPDDVEIARQSTFEIHEERLFTSAWWMDPVYLGQYPEQGLRFFEKDMPKIGADDMKTISQPLDFQGVNIYHGTVVRKGKDSLAEEVPAKIGEETTEMGWQVVPQALYWGPKFFYERYKKPVLVTENGVAGMDWVCSDGSVHDPQRIEYVTRYLKEYQKAIEEGVDAKGYFYWSFTDNFEWLEGYTKRFGLVHVDYDTQERHIKDSGFWYRDLIRANGQNVN
jgi:beta-glucosidase